jgi:hypothetical protein
MISQKMKAMHKNEHENPDEKYYSNGRITEEDCVLIDIEIHEDIPEDVIKYKYQISLE